jgi:hypothetical protein
MIKEVFERNWETNGFRAWKTKKGICVKIWNKNQGMYTGRKALLRGWQTLPTVDNWQVYLDTAKYPGSSYTLKKGHKI